MGGEDAFIGKLDSLFTADSSLEGETTSSDISGLIGQYAHGNEPSHHVIHMYNYVNRPWRTQELVDSVYRSQYADAVDGLSGNEDCRTNVRLGMYSILWDSTGMVRGIGLFYRTPRIR